MCHCNAQGVLPIVLHVGIIVIIVITLKWAGAGTYSVFRAAEAGERGDEAGVGEGVGAVAEEDEAPEQARHRPGILP